jgi:hypothetical protein
MGFPLAEGANEGGVDCVALIWEGKGMPHRSPGIVAGDALAAVAGMLGIDAAKLITQVAR